MLFPRHRSKENEMPIRLPILAGCALLLASCAGAGPGLTGNDTGGIIPYSPENRRVARDMAFEHCAHFGKRAFLTGVDARYGGYISFACRYDRHFDPRASY
jgi:hypothetical protein